MEPDAVGRVGGTAYDRITDENKTKMIKKLYDGAIRAERIRLFTKIRKGK